MSIGWAMYILLTKSLKYSGPPVKKNTIFDLGIEQLLNTLNLHRLFKMFNEPQRADDRDK